MTKEIQDRQINWYLKDKWPKKIPIIWLSFKSEIDVIVSSCMYTYIENVCNVYAVSKDCTCFDLNTI